jgi:UrcA family protein
MTTHKILAVALAGAFLGCGAAWSAPPVHLSGNSFSTQIDYSDLDVHNPADARVRIDRVRQAARRVCEDAAPEHPLLFGPEDQGDHKCIQAASERAISKLNVPEVTAAYRDMRLAEAAPTR